MEKFEIYKIKESSWSKVFLAYGKTSHCRYILKYNHDGYYLKYEYEILSFLRSQGIKNVPCVISYKNFNNSKFLIIEYLRNNEKFGADSIGRIAKVLAKIHSIKTTYNKINYFWFVNKKLEEAYCLVNYIKYFSSYSAIYRKSLKLLRLLTNKILSESMIYQKRSDFYFINGDLSGGSIFLNNKRVSIIDWHLAQFGDRAWDIARLFFNYSNLIDRKLFFKNYFRYIQDDTNFIKRLTIYWIINRIFMANFNILNSEWYPIPAADRVADRIETSLDLLLLNCNKLILE